MTITKDNVKKALKKTWYFIWENDSIWSWILNIILAFVLIKFIIYPGLGLVLGTNYPIVAVVSGSMEHDGNFDTWWESSAACKENLCSQEQWYNNYGISRSEFEGYRFNNGFNKGDIIFLSGVRADKVNEGDVVVFQTSYRKEPIIHRVVKISSKEGNNIYQTKGDHNMDSGKYDENIQESQVIGKGVFKVPYLGWIKIGFVNLLGMLGLHIS
ncbi:MAG: signal peptidase I [Candidatus Woesearchaeota archaeon]